MGGKSGWQVKLCNSEQLNKTELKFPASFCKNENTGI